MDGVKDPSPGSGVEGPVTVFAYDAAGNVRYVSDPLLNITEYEYDARHRRTRTLDADPDGPGFQTTPQTRFEYDAASQLKKWFDPENDATEFAYDKLGRQIMVLAPAPVLYGSELPAKKTFEYDAVGNLKKEHVWREDNSKLTTAYEYDALHRSTRVIDPNNATTDFTYDKADNLSTVTDPTGNKTEYFYDGLDRAKQERNQLGKSRYIHYDAVGNVTWVTDRNNRRVDFGYDNLDRVTSEVWAGVGGRTLNFSYDAAGQLLTASDPSASFAYVYDGLGRLDAETQTIAGAGGNMMFDPAYDLAGNRTRQAIVFNGAVQSNGTVTGGTADLVNSYVYDRLHRLSSVTQSSATGVPTFNSVAPKHVVFTYKPSSQLETITRYQATTATPSALVASTSYFHDRAGRVTRIQHVNSTSTILNAHDYQYDRANRITSYSNSWEGSRNFTYDGRDQLLGASGGTIGNENYVYDSNGNRTTANGQSYQTDPNNRLKSDGVYNFEYDDEGNRKKRTEIATGKYTNFSWDHRNRLVNVTDYSAGGQVLKTVDFTYDVFDRRLSKSVDPDGSGAQPAVSDVFVNDGSQVILQLRDPDGLGSQVAILTHRYLHGPGIDMILADEQNLSVTGFTLWGLADQQGTVRDVVDSTGRVREHVSYDAYGKRIAEQDFNASGGSISSTDPAAVDFLFGYTGREFDDETGLNYYRARYYDPAAGRFLSEDPIGFAAGDANLSRYVGNSPTLSTDPSGLQEPQKPRGPMLSQDRRSPWEIWWDELRAKMSRDPRDYEVVTIDDRIYVVPGVGCEEGVTSEALRNVHHRIVLPIYNGGKSTIIRAGRTISNPLGQAKDDLIMISRLPEIPIWWEQLPDHKKQDVLMDTVLQVIVAREVTGGILSRAPKGTVPSKVTDTLDTVRRTGKPPTSHGGGRRFENREGKLPKGGRYREYDVDPLPPRGTRRNAERIVIDEDTGRVWYTDDHYDTFTEILDGN